MASPVSAPSPSKQPAAVHPRFVETFNSWAQAIGIVVAALWGFYTFVYKEIWEPKSAPVNITMTLQLKRVDAGQSKKQFEAVEMRVSASNPSSRKIYLLPSMWTVEGFRVTPKHPDSASFYERTTALMTAQGGQYETADAIEKPRGVIAAGSLFADNWLSPSETVTRTVIVYIPRDEWDGVFARTAIPSAEVANGIELHWSPSKKDGGPEEVLYLVNKRGEREPVQRDQREGFLKDDRVKRMGFQEATSSAEMSLWN